MGLSDLYSALVGSLNQWHIKQPVQQNNLLEQLPDEVIFAIVARLDTTKDILAFRSACRRHWQLLDLAGLKYLSRLAFSDSAANIARIEEAAGMQEAIDVFSRIRDLYVVADELEGAWVDNPEYFNLQSISENSRPYLVGRNVFWFHINGTIRGVKAGAYKLQVDVAWPVVGRRPSVTLLVKGVTIGELHLESGTEYLSMKKKGSTAGWLLRSYFALIYIEEDKTDEVIELKNIDDDVGKNIAIRSIRLEKISQ